jgi:hypothetical protein
MAMRLLATSLFALFLLIGHQSVRAEGESDAFRAVIEAQLEAFRNDDGGTAFSFASPTIKGLFGTPENFMAMVVQGYPQVYRPSRVTFGAVITHLGQPTQMVHLVGPTGEVVTAYYQMQQQADGSWKINGVFLEPATTA